jgi:hypothetical protein
VQEVIIISNYQPCSCHIVNVFLITVLIATFIEHRYRTSHELRGESSDINEILFPYRRSNPPPPRATQMGPKTFCLVLDVVSVVTQINP